MKLSLIKIFLIYLISITLCTATRYDCDQRGIPCGCGFKNVDINEQSNSPEEAIPLSWSMIVSIRYDCTANGDPYTHCCSGTILNDRHILTVGSCFNSTLLPDNITIAASIHSLSQNCQTIRVVEQVSIHPDWTPTNRAMHNIAILHLAEPLDFSTDFILRQACLPSRMDTPVETEDNTTLVVVGWSVLSNSNDNTDRVLQQMVVHHFDSNDSLCARSADDNELLLCAERDGGLSNLFVYSI
jgi:secreted trypsin-like serine protease